MSWTWRISFEVMGMAWMIDGNKLKEKAVALLFPSKMELSGYLPDPVQAVTVSEIEGMLYRDGIELVRCKECQYREDSEVRDRIWCRKLGRYMKEDGFCSFGEGRNNE